MELLCARIHVSMPFWTKRKLAGEAIMNCSKLLKLTEE